MTNVYVDDIGAIKNEDCPIYRIRKLSDGYKGMLLVSVNGIERRITKEQWKMLEDFMRGW